MSLKCKIGLHTWNGCKCSHCGIIRDEQHDWSKDCEKCSKCGKICDNQHDYSKDCEKCSKCGKSRDNQHNWSKDCEKCSKCGKIRYVQHNWSKDCKKCSKCGKIRDNQHDYSKDCEKCSKCGKSRDNQHNWSKDCEKCSKCSKIRDEQHNWSKDCEKCSKCGKIRENHHAWDGCKCKECGKTRDEEHDWDGCKCSKCGKVRDEQHSWEGCKCLKCGEIAVEGHNLANGYHHCSICGTSGYKICRKAIQKNNIEVIALLLDLGLDAYSNEYMDRPKNDTVSRTDLFADLGPGKGDELDVPLVLAVADNKLSLIEFMVSRGVSVLGKAFGSSLFTHSLRYASSDVAMYLVNKGFSLTERDNHGNTLLHNATNEKMINLLIKCGADVNAKGNSGWTPLHKAAANCEIEAIKALLANGANKSIRDIQGNTPYDVCIKMGLGIGKELLL